MTKEEAKIPKEDLEFTVDELNRELLDNAEGDDSISKESGAVMVEELKAAAEEIDVDDVFTQRTADVLRSLGVETKFSIKKEKKVMAAVKKKVKTKTVGKKSRKRVPVSKKVEGKKEEVKKKTSTKQKATKYSRIDSIIDAVEALYKKGMSVNDVMEKSNNLYNKKTGGEGEVNKSGFMVTATTTALKTLVQFQVLKTEDNLYIKN